MHEKTQKELKVNLSWATRGSLHCSQLNKAKSETESPQSLKEQKENTVFSVAEGKKMKRSLPTS